MPILFLITALAGEVEIRSRDAGTLTCGAQSAEFTGRTALDVVVFPAECTVDIRGGTTTFTAPAPGHIECSMNRRDVSCNAFTVDEEVEAQTNTPTFETGEFVLGGFHVSVEKDRMDDTPLIIAATPSIDAGTTIEGEPLRPLFALRCAKGEYDMFVATDYPIEQTDSKATVRIRVGDTPAQPFQAEISSDETSIGIPAETARQLVTTDGFLFGWLPQETTEQVVEFKLNGMDEVRELMSPHCAWDEPEDDEPDRR